MADPPRSDSAATVAAHHDLGLDVKMVTGDQVAIGSQIAHQVDLGTRVLRADALTAADGDQAAALVERADGFAQIFPEHEHRIVQLLPQRGHIVGMTGDGVNDAPAMK